MRNHLIAFSLGVLAFQLMPSLPPRAIYLLTLPALGAWYRWPQLRIAVALIVGFLLAAVNADRVISGRLAQRFEGQAVRVVGRVVDVRRSSSLARKVLIAVESLAGAAARPFQPQVFQLTVYGGGWAPRPGDECRVYARLRRPVGRRNPGSPDYERRMLAKGISGTGYLIHHPANECRAGRGGRALLARIRADLAAAIRNVPAGDATAVIGALAVADRSGLSAAQWAVLRGTGTAHLVAISGLHISLVAGFAFALGRWCASPFTVITRRWPAQHCGALAAVAAAIMYAALAGFTLPTQRALIMLVAAAAYQLLRLRPFTFDTIAVALAATLAIDPFAGLSGSFWLSFAAVSAVIFVLNSRRYLSAWRRLLTLQLLLSVGLTPLLGLLFQELPLTSPLANLVAIPVVSFTVVPLALIGVAAWGCGAAWAELLWDMAARIWALLWLLLEVMVEYAEPLRLATAPSIVLFALAVFGISALFVPLLRSRILFAGLLMSALAVPRREAFGPSEFRFTLLDVGQGLAIVVETAGHVLVYDTGPRFGHADAGRAIVVPYLKARGIRRVDRLLVSHDDNDHAGGAASLSAAVEVVDTMVSPLSQLPARSVCLAGDGWVWDGVVFEVLHPPNPYSGSRNDGSCVLRVSVPGGSVLLPGDIEAAAEYNLLARRPRALAADVLVAPHHGSLTSSMIEFVQAVSPHYVLFAAGYRNRFGLPAQAVVARYEALGAVPLYSWRTGAMEFRIGAVVEAPRLHRDAHRRYWQMF